jgi:hypothetical protein
MEVATPITKQPAGITFLVSVGIVSLVAVLELGGIAWAFFSHLQGTPASSSEAVAAATAQPAPSGTSSASGVAGEEKLALNDPLLAVPEPTPVPTPSATPEPALPKPTPVSVARREQPAAPTLDRASVLVEQARVLREGGDTLTALTRLREAQAVSPDNPKVISEMAITYEKMGLADKARDQWRRIYLMGEAAGIYYAAADAKLNALRAPGEPVPGSSEPTTSAASAESVNAPGMANKDASGFQPNASLAMAEVVRGEVNDPNAQTHFSLKIPVKCRPGTKVDVHEVVVQVFFYDLLDDRSVVQTSATVNSQWTTPPTDWAEDNLEILEVEYTLPKPDPRDPSRPMENRKYYGYMVRIYYKKELQDMRAEPIKLLQQFPTSTTLQTDDSR